MRTRPLVSVLAATLVATNPSFDTFAAPGHTATVSVAEVEALKAELARLQQRLAALEAAQQAQAVQLQAASAASEAQTAVDAEQQEAIDRTTDALAQTRAGIGDWVGRFQWKGDFRYRNETIDQQYSATERNRDRIRARVGFVARVNDTVRVELRATSGDGDPRSANQTLTNSNSRKDLLIDLAYGEWVPRDEWRMLAGKMPYPWQRTASYFFDGDVNPEGFAVQWRRGADGLFGSAFYTHLAERGTRADSNMLGLQLGWRGQVRDDGRLTLAAAYFDHGAVEGYNPFWNGSAENAFGNTVIANPVICRRGIATCLANDFDVLEWQAEYATELGGRPLTLFADFARNLAAKRGDPVQGVDDGLDTAYSAGFSWGRASAPQSWEIGYLWQQVDKDALFAQWIDSNYGDGRTDARGGVLRLAYAPSRNWRINATYFMNETNIDGPVAVSFPVAQTVRGRDYRRLQIDLNTSF
jgi:hypothetical protein